MAALKLTFAFQFVASKLGKTGLTPTYTVKTVNRTTGAIGSAVTGSCTELFDGLYFAQLASCDPRTYVYAMSAHTTDTTVDQQDIGAFWAEFSPAADVALPDAAASAAGGLATIGSGAGQFAVNGAGAISNVATVASVTALANNSITAAAIAAAALNGKGDWATAANVSSAQTAILAAVTALNNLSALANIFGPQAMEIPDAGTTQYPFTIVIHDNEGKLVDLDTSPTLAASNAAGTSLSANLSAVTHSGTGRYTFTYGVANNAVEQGIRITGDGTIGAEARHVEYIGAAVNFDTLTTLAAIKAKTDQLTFLSGGDPITGDPVLEVVGMYLADSAIRAGVLDTGARNAIGVAVRDVSNAAPAAGSLGAAANTSLANQTTILNRIGAFTGAGINTILGFLKVIFSSAAGATPTDMGGTGTAANNSLQAIRTRGDLAWTTGSGGGGGGTGTGTTPIDHDGGDGVTVDGDASDVDCLRYVGTDNGGRALFVVAYLASEWDAVPTVRSPKGTTRTGSDGRWLAPLMLDSGTYYLVADIPGDIYEAQKTTVVVP